MSYLICLILIISIPTMIKFDKLEVSDASDNNSILKKNDQFKTHVDKPIPPIYINSEQFGDQREFWIFDFFLGQYIRLRATLLSVGDFCYVYMDNQSIITLGQESAIERCEIVRNEFDSTIYPANYDLIGDPSGLLGDIDGDPHITVFLQRNAGSGAYYSLVNELVGRHFSNNREMIYVGSLANICEIIADVCHETNHLFLFNQDEDEAVFIYEGLAEFSKYYAGHLSNSSILRGEMTFNITMSAVYFLNYPRASLFFFDEEYDSYASYGISYLFMLYLAEKYGVELIREIALNNLLDGPAAIDEALTNNSYDINFNDLFLDFITACILDELNVFDDIYGFNNADFQLDTKTIIYEYPLIGAEFKHGYYSITSLKLLSPPNELTLKIENPSYPRSLGYSIAIYDENGWNITQTVISGEDDFSYVHLNGQNIEFMYIISSLIRENILNAPMQFTPTPIESTEFHILLGFVNPPTTTPSTSETQFQLILLTPLFFVLVVLQKRKRFNSK